MIRSKLVCYALVATSKQPQLSTEYLLMIVLPCAIQYCFRHLRDWFVEVTGSQVNRGAGYGLEIPCIYIYQLYGPKAYTNRITIIFCREIYMFSTVYLIGVYTRCAYIIP